MASVLFNEACNQETIEFVTVRKHGDELCNYDPF